MAEQSFALFSELPFNMDEEQTFTIFSKLPAELRLQVWYYAERLLPRVFEAIFIRPSYRSLAHPERPDSSSWSILPSSIPILLQVNKESRWAVLSHYKMPFSQDLNLRTDWHLSTKTLQFNPKNDALFIGTPHITQSSPEDFVPSLDKLFATLFESQQTKIARSLRSLITIGEFEDRWFTKGLPNSNYKKLLPSLEELWVKYDKDVMGMGSVG